MICSIVMQDSGQDSVKLPTAAIVSIAILIYTTLIVIGLVIRRFLLQKDLCKGPCPHITCCSCSELGLRVVETCSCCPANLTCDSLLDIVCPSKEMCLGWNFQCCDGCSEYLKCNSNSECCNCAPCLTFLGPFQSCMCCQSACQTCNESCNNCFNRMSCPKSECSTINCLCCEISIKGRGHE